MGNKVHKQLWQNFTYLWVVQGLGLVLSLAVIPYTVARVGVDGFGVIAVAQVLMIYLAVGVDFGFNQTAARDTALANGDKQRLSEIISTVIISKLALNLAAFLLLLILVAAIPLFRIQATVYLFGFSFVLGQSLSLNWFFQGLEKMKMMASLSLLSKLLFTAAVFLFIHKKEDAWLYLFLMGAANIVTALAGMLVVYSMKIRFQLPRWTAMKKEWKEGWQIMGSNLSMTTIQYSGLFILRIFTSDAVAGTYSIAEKIYLAMKLMLESFSQAIYPRICLAAKEGAVQFRQLVNMIFRPFVLLLVLLLLLVVFFAGPIIAFFLHRPDAYAADLLRWLCLAVLFVCLNIPAAQLLLARDQKKRYFRIFSIGMLVNLAASFILVPSMAATGTVTAILLTEAAILAGLYLAQRSPTHIWI